MRILSSVAVLILFINSYYGQVVQNGLVAYYQFNNDLLDETSGNNDLSVVQGNVSYSSTSLPNHQSIYFDGATRLKSINVFDNSTYTETSIALWIKTTTVTSNLQVILQGSYVGFGVYLQANTGKLLGFFGSNSANAYVSSNSITDGQWHHVVAQSNGSTTYVFIDGVLDGTTTTDGFYNGNGSANNLLYLGKSNLDAYPFTGEVYDLRIYDRTLNGCEIDTLSNKSLTEGMVSHYSFDNTLLDSGSYNNSLQLVQGTTTYNLPFKAIYFDGSTRLKSTSSFDNSSFSQTAISTWFKTSNITNDLQILLQGANVGFGIYMAPSSGKILCFFGGNSANAYSSNAYVADGQWHHVLAQSNGTTTYVYIDGVLDGTTNGDGFFNGTGGTNNLLYLGKSNLDAYPYTGYIADIKIYDRTLNDCEVEELSNKGFETTNIEADKDLTSKVDVFPNPFVDQINLSSEIEIKTVTVYDLKGNIVLNKTYDTPSKNTSINTKELPRAIYLLKINNSINKRLVKL